MAYFRTSVRGGGKNEIGMFSYHTYNNDGTVVITNCILNDSQFVKVSGGRSIVTQGKTMEFSNNAIKALTKGKFRYCKVNTNTQGQILPLSSMTSFIDVELNVGDTIEFGGSSRYTAYVIYIG